MLVEGQQFPVVHPLNIHSKLYRESDNPESKFLHMKAMHDYLWPSQVPYWHYWTEDRFRAHCEGYLHISYAGGASTAKSYDAAKIAILFWLGYMKQRSVIVASTSLSSLESRIWGYVCALLNEVKIPLPYRYFSGAPPKIIFKDENQESDQRLKDTIHGMYAVAAKRGDDENTISSWIGRHPKNGLLIILDEGTDMPVALMKALPNLSANMNNAGKSFQCMIIGNSKSKFDLHGAMSTPKDGWDSVDPLKHKKWETTQKEGICLFFSCYESPAIHEADPLLRKRLSTFLASAEEIAFKEEELGKDSESFYRFVLGFWQSSTTDDNVMSEAFLTHFGANHPVEWSGTHNLVTVAGLDPAYSTGGDKCMLRLAVLGYDVRGQRVLDFMGDRLLFPIDINPVSEEAAEIQIAKQVLKILAEYRCSIKDLAVDSNGQGRALSSVIQLQAGVLDTPLKIYSTRTAAGTKNSFDVEIITTYDLWFSMRNFVQSGQIRRLDVTAMQQFSQRKVERLKNSNKKVLETKPAFKARMGAVNPRLARSPDEADAATLALQIAIKNYGFRVGAKVDVSGASSAWEDEKMLIHAQNMRIEEQKTIEAHKKPPEATFGVQNLMNMGNIKIN